MKNIFGSLLIVFILLSVTLKSEIINTSIVISDSLTNKIENKQLLFGVFFEFLNEFLVGEQGLWAQEIYDRGFDHYLGTEYAAKWGKYNTESDNHVRLKSGGYNINGLYYQNIKSDIDEKIGLKQDLYIDIEVGNNFYIYLRNNTQNSSKFQIELLSQSTNEILYQHSIEITNNQWQKYEISIPAITADNRVSLALCLNGIGDIDLDEVSLMPANNVNGVRKEFFDMFIKWKPGIIRYPGGGFADTECSHLDYCIGDIDQRKSPQFIINTYQRMDFGVDELMTFCKAIDAQAHLVVNLVDGTAAEAANWVDYTNGNATTIYGQKRINAGYNEPYNVKYWEIGNEQWNNNAWMLPRYIEYYDAMKSRDYNIRCIIDGNWWGGKEYFDELMDYVGEKCENYGWHYAGSITNNELDLSDTNITYQRIMAMGHSIDEQMETYKRYLIEKGLFPNCKQSITENIYLWGKVNNWIDTTYRNSTLEAGLFEASTLMSVLRNSSSMEIYEKTFGIGHIRVGFNSKGKRVFYPTPFHTLIDFFANSTADKIMHSIKYSPEYLYGVYTDEYKIKVPFLESLVSSSDDTLNIYLLNTSPIDTLNVEISNFISIDTNEISIFNLNSNSILDHNTPDEPNKICLTKSKITNINKLYLQPHSFICIKAKLKNPANINLNNSEISLMPNPANEFVRIVSNNSFEIDNIKVYNILGNLLIDKDCFTNDIQLDIKNLGKGTYYVDIKTLKAEYRKIFTKL